MLTIHEWDEMLVVDDVGFITRNAWPRVSAADVPYLRHSSQRPPAVITVTTQYGVTGRRFYHPDIDRVVWTWRSLQVTDRPPRHQAWPLPTAYLDSIAFMMSMLDSLCGCRHSDSAQPSIVCGLHCHRADNQSSVYSRRPLWSTFN